MKRTLIFIAVFTIFSMSLQAQCDEFVIYRAKGSVNLLQGTTSVAAQKNMRLVGDTRLNIGKDAAVILLSGKDKALRITTPGTFTLAWIRATCMQNQSSLTKEYLNYVAQTIIDQGEPKTAMVIKGAVYRSRTVFEKTPMILPADSSVITNDPVIFTWKPGAAGTPKYLLIYENGVKEVFSKLVSDSSLTLEASHFKPQSIYFWLVSNTLTPSDKEPRFTFLLGGHDWQTKFLDQWNLTMKELEGDIDSLKLKMGQKKKP